MFLVDNPVELGNELVFRASSVEELRAGSLAKGFGNHIAAILFKQLSQSFCPWLRHHSQSRNLTFVAIQQTVEPNLLA